MGDVGACGEQKAGKVLVTERRMLRGLSARKRSPVSVRCLHSISPEQIDCSSKGWSQIFFKKFRYQGVFSA